MTSEASDSEIRCRDRHEHKSYIAMDPDRCRKVIYCCASLLSRSPPLHAVHSFPFTLFSLSIIIMLYLSLYLHDSSCVLCYVPPRYAIYTLFTSLNLKINRSR